MSLLGAHPDSAPTLVSPDQLLLIEAEKVRTQYRNMPTAMLGTATIATLMGFALIKGVGFWKVSLWVLAVYAWTATRYFNWRAFRRRCPAPEEMRPWGQAGLLGSAVLGAIWGAGMVAMYLPQDVPQGMAYQLFLVMGLVGMAAGSVFASGSALLSFFAFLYPALLPAVVLFAREGDLLHGTIAVLLVLYLGLITLFAFRVYGSIVEFIRTRYQNLDLIEELRHRKEAAEEASIAKSRFLAAASHDLRQPLHALGLFVQSLQESSLAARERQVIGNIRRSVDAMEELFNSLLDISRLDAGVVQPRVKVIPLSAILDRVRFEYAPIARQKRLSLTVMKTSLYVSSDPSLLERIIRNLLVNAIRYTDQGGIVLGCRRSGGEVRIEVWDTGRGIPGDRHNEIFREFYQLEHHDSDRPKGLGLGLAIVQRLAVLLGHRIDLRSVVGQGSLFAVTAPRAAKEDHVPVESVPEALGAFDLSHALVLVIDDEPTVQEGMATLLRKWRCDVLTAGSGREMLDKVSAVQRLPDMIVCDYRLRGEENGIQVVEMLRSEFNVEIPAMLVTGDTAPDRLRDAETSGLPILHKPLNPARLRTLLSNLLRSHTRAA